MSAISNFDDSNFDSRRSDDTDFCDYCPEILARKLLCPDPNEPRNDVFHIIIIFKFFSLQISKNNKQLIVPGFVLQNLKIFFGFTCREIAESTF